MSWNFDGTDDWVGNKNAAPVTTYAGGITGSIWFKLDTLGDGRTLIWISNAAGTERI